MRISRYLPGKRFHDSERVHEVGDNEEVQGAGDGENVEGVEYPGVAYIQNSFSLYVELDQPKHNYL